MKTKRFYLIIISILILLNCGTLLFFWLNRPMHHGPKAFYYIVEQVGMTEKQESDYAKLRDSHRQVMDKKMDHIKQLKESLFSDMLDTDHAEKIADEIAAEQKEIELLTFKHFQEVRNLCTEEQQGKFDKCIQEAVKMMLPPPPPKKP